MSLEYRNEETPPAEATDATAGYQRASAVFPLYTVVLIASLVAVFGCQVFIDGAETIVWGGGVSTLLAGFVKPLFSYGQYWRILTGAALHLGIIHLFFNSYALYQLGRLVETLSNRAHLALVFLLSAVGGGILSLIFLPGESSVGASGGIVGLLGYLTVYAFKRRKLLPAGFLKNMLFNVGFMIFIGVFLNQLGGSEDLPKSGNLPKIDNFGHLGGLIAGAFYGLVQVPRDLYKNPTVVSEPVKIIGAAAFVIFILTCIFSILILLGIVVIPFPRIPALIE